MKKISILIVALLPLLHLSAQDTTYNSYNESVYVQGDFKPVIEKSFKLSFAPSITDTTETMKHSFSYGITPQRITSVFMPARLAPTKITDRPQRLYNNYMRLGMGNYWSPLADLYYHSTQSKNLNYGARLYHESSWGKIGKAADPDSLPSPTYYGRNHFSNTGLSLFGKYILKNNHQFCADLDYSNDYSMFYGFSDSTLFAANGLLHDSLNSKDYGMSYNDVKLRLGAKSLNTDLNKFGYEANAALGNMWGRYGMSELYGNVDGTVHYGFPFLKQSKGIAYLHLGWQGWSSRFTPSYGKDSVWQMPYLYAPAATASYLDTTYASGRQILRANPYVDFLFHRFQVHAGAKLDFDKFSYVDSLRFCPFLDVILSTNFMDDALNISLGAVGDLDANDWNAIRLVNPYVMPNAEERATKHWDFFGHMRLTFSKKLELNARVQLSQIKDDLNFKLNRDYQLHNVYMTDYVTYTQATVGANLTFVNDEASSIDLGGHYYGYVTSDTDPLLYRPNWDASLKLNINYKDKVRMHLEGLLIGKMTGDMNLTSSENDILPMRTGVSAEVEYLHTRALSFFAKFDNILCQRYFLWSNYPSQRINVMLGLTYTIPTR